MSNITFETLSLCVDCYDLLDNSEQLPKLDAVVVMWSNDGAPHFVKGGAHSCDGCDTKLGGDRHDVKLTLG